MAAKNSTGGSFLEWYSSTMPLRQAAAAEIGKWMKERVSDLGVAVDSISARAKDLRSIRGKLREKRYKNPSVEMTDMIGVRTVLLFENEIETVTTYLRDALTISDRYSRKAGEELALAEFGYRSVHLIARFRGRTMPSYARIGRPWVEVQVRSLLQHAWAAIGHDHLYKGALVYPNMVKRRFFAVAGSLELFDREFDLIRAYRLQSHKEWYSAFQLGKRTAERYDIAGVGAFFEHLFPGSVWSDLPRGRPLLPAIEIALMNCLRRAGITTARDLRMIVQKSGYRRRLQTYASSIGTSPNAVANFAKSVLAIGEKRSTLLLRDYEELIEDPLLRAAVSL